MTGGPIASELGPEPERARPGSGRSRLRWPGNASSTASPLWTSRCDFEAGAPARSLGDSAGCRKEPVRGPAERGLGRRPPETRTCVRPPRGRRVVHGERWTPRGDGVVLRRRQRGRQRACCVGAFGGGQPPHEFSNNATARKATYRPERAVPETVRPHRIWNLTSYPGLRRFPAPRPRPRYNNHVSTGGFRLRYLARTAAGVPRDLANTLVISKLKPIRPTVLIYNCTWVCDAQCEMCNNWKHGDRKSDMTLAQLEPAMAHPFWGAVENLNISGGEPTTRNDLPEMVEMFHRHLPRMRKIGINTTGLTPHRAIPMLTRDRRVLRRARSADQHPRLARRHRRRPRSGPRT